LSEAEIEPSFFLKKKETLLMNNYIKKRKKTEKGQEKRRDLVTKNPFRNCTPIPALASDFKIQKAMWVNNPGTQIWCTLSR